MGNLVISQNPERKIHDITLAVLVGVSVLSVFYVVQTLYLGIFALLLIPFFDFNKKLATHKLIYFISILLFFITILQEVPKIFLTKASPVFTLGYILFSIIFIISYFRKNYIGVVSIGALSYLVIYTSHYTNSEILGGWISNIDASPVLDNFVICLFFIMMTRLVIKRDRIEDVDKIIFAMIILSHASNYFFSAIAKIYIFRNEHPLYWVLNNETDLLVKHAVDQKIDLIGAQFISGISTWTDAVTIFMNGFVFFVQLLSLIIISNRRLCILLLTLYDVMHLGIFLLTGIFFWKWMILNLIFVAVIRSDANQLEFKRYFVGMPTLKFATITITSFFFLCAVYKSNITVAWLGWHDTPLRNEVSIQLKNPASDEFYEIPHALLLDLSLPAVQGMVFSSPNNPHPGLRNIGILGAVSELGDRNFAYEYCGSRTSKSTFVNLTDEYNHLNFTTKDTMDNISLFVSQSLERLADPVRNNSFLSLAYPHHIFPGMRHLSTSINDICEEAHSTMNLNVGLQFTSKCVGSDNFRTETVSQFSNENIYSKICE